MIETCASLARIGLFLVKDRRTRLPSHASRITALSVLPLREKFFSGDENSVSTTSNRLSSTLNPSTPESRTAKMSPSPLERPLPLLGAQLRSASSRRRSATFFESPLRERLVLPTTRRFSFKQCFVSPT